MTDQRFQEILSELERWDFQEVIAMTRDCFRRQHKEEEKRACFKITFLFNFRWWEKSCVKDGFLVEPHEVISTLKSLSDEDLYAIHKIMLTPVIEYLDGSGEVKQFELKLPSGRGVYSCYDGDIRPYWQELWYSATSLDGREVVVSRSALGAGRIVASLSEGPLKIFLMDDRSVVFLKGDTIVEFDEVEKPLKEVVPGLKVGLFYKCNNKRQIERKAAYFLGDDPVPSGCHVTVRITQTGGYEYEGKKIVRTSYGDLTEDYDRHGVRWKNFPKIWGFHRGKMIIGTNCPAYNAEAYCDLIGLLAPGVEYTFPIEEEQDEDSYGAPARGTVVVSWTTEELIIEINDGVLKAIPDAKEIVIPAEVDKIDREALLTAPSLRKITLHQGVKEFAWALEEFHRRNGVKLDVEYHGNLQQWFDVAGGLASHIGQLTIGGKEYNFYKTADVVIPKGITRIGSGFFKYSEVICSVVLPPEVVEIGCQAFAYCKKLESVEVQGKASIGGDAFVSCKELRSVYLSDGVSELGSGCFDFLPFSDIFIPASVKHIRGVLSQQNDGWAVGPRFLCEAPSRPEGWYEHWHLAYFDPRFGMGHGYDYYHPVKWGVKRAR